MKIASFAVQSGSEHYVEKSSVSSERLEIWAGDRIEKGMQQREEDPSVVVELRFRGANQKKAKNTRISEASAEGDRPGDELDVKLRLIESFVYALTGKRIQLRQLSLDRETNASGTTEQPVQSESGGAGWGIVYDSFNSYSENEQIRYSSTGNVMTADGRNISFGLNFTMSRSYYEQNSVSIRLGDAARMDPLVIAYDGATPQLSKEKYAFDLNGDGSAENISFALGGSGFLAFDKNGDGVINNGTELFGTQSGNGFEDLRAYDSDKNGWIDESDPVFSMLSVFTVGEDGDRTVFSLGDAGVGAIYLQETQTQFSFTDGRTNDGLMRASSIFLRENGTAGTIHHIDLSI